MDAIYRVRHRGAAGCAAGGQLAERFPLSGRGIFNAVFKAAAVAVHRSGATRRIIMTDLAEAAEQEVSPRDSRRLGF